ncbi:MAG: cupin [Candidatus Hydrogenedentes bacterium]|nr:cupin [Candidatus Hydrogenedentota bacterium]
MPVHIPGPTTIQAAGDPPKTINEYIGRVNSGTPGVSIAHMISPCGWKEPGQRPEFTEYTVVLRGALHVGLKDGGTIEVQAGEAILTNPGEWVQYSTPGADGAEYIAVCLPAFSPELVHRDQE